MSENIYKMRELIKIFESENLSEFNSRNHVDELTTIRLKIKTLIKSAEEIIKDTKNEKAATYMATNWLPKIIDGLDGDGGLQDTIDEINPRINADMMKLAKAVNKRLAHVNYNLEKAVSEIAKEHNIAPDELMGIYKSLIKGAN